MDTTIQCRMDGYVWIRRIRPIRFLLVIEGLKYIDASIGALIRLLEIIFSFIFGIIFFNDVLTISSIVGGLIIITAAILPDAYSIKSTVTMRE